MQFDFNTCVGHSRTFAPGGHLPRGEVLPARKLVSAVFRAEQRMLAISRSWLRRPRVFTARPALESMPESLRARVLAVAGMPTAGSLYDRGGSPFRYVRIYVARFDTRDFISRSGRLSPPRPGEVL